MADARTIIDGRMVTAARYNTTDSGHRVANLRIMAGRSKKNDQGGYDTITDTAFDVAFWNVHADFVNALSPQVGDTVIAHGTITGLEAYDGKNGTSLSVKVSGDGLRVFPKREQQQGGGYQQGGQQAQQAQGGNRGWQYGDGAQQEQGGSWGANPNAQQADPWAQSSMAPQGEEPPF